MTSKTNRPKGGRAARPDQLIRRFGDLAPVYADGRSNAIGARTRKAADRMWKKVAEDLARIDGADLGGARND
jgi:hypothetical protein